MVLDPAAGARIPVDRDDDGDDEMKDVEEESVEKDLGIVDEKVGDERKASGLSGSELRDIEHRNGTPASSFSGRMEC